MCYQASFPGSWGHCFSDLRDGVVLIHSLLSVLVTYYKFVIPLSRFNGAGCASKYGTSYTCVTTVISMRYKYWGIHTYDDNVLSQSFRLTEEKAWYTQTFHLTSTVTPSKGTTPYPSIAGTFWLGVMPDLVLMGGNGASIVWHNGTRSCGHYNKHSHCTGSTAEGSKTVDISPLHSPHSAWWKED